MGFEHDKAVSRGGKTSLHSPPSTHPKTKTPGPRRCPGPAHAHTRVPRAATSIAWYTLGRARRAHAAPGKSQGGIGVLSRGRQRCHTVCARCAAPQDTGRPSPGDRPPSLWSSVPPLKTGSHQRPHVPRGRKVRARARGRTVRDAVRHKICRIASTAQSVVLPFR